MPYQFGECVRTTPHNIDHGYVRDIPCHDIPLVFHVCDILSSRLILDIYALF